MVHEHERRNSCKGNIFRIVQYSSRRVDLGSMVHIEDKTRTKDVKNLKALALM